MLEKVNGSIRLGNFIYLHQRNYRGINTWGQAKRKVRLT
jgi:hypothetical protein